MPQRFRELEQKTRLLICVNDVFALESRGYESVVHSLFQMIHVPVIFRARGETECFLAELARAGEEAANVEKTSFPPSSSHFYWNTGTYIVLYYTNYYYYYLKINDLPSSTLPHHSVFIAQFVKTLLIDAYWNRNTSRKASTSPITVPIPTRVGMARQYGRGVS